VEKKGIMPEVATFGKVHSGELGCKPLALLKASIPIVQDHSVENVYFVA
jgi:hypothetical protein